MATIGPAVSPLQEKLRIRTIGGMTNGETNGVPDPTEDVLAGVGPREL